MKPKTKKKEKTHKERLDEQFNELLDAGLDWKLEEELNKKIGRIDNTEDAAVRAAEDQRRKLIGDLDVLLVRFRDAGKQFETYIKTGKMPSPPIAPDAAKPKGAAGPVDSSKAMRLKCPYCTSFTVTIPEGQNRRQCNACGRFVYRTASIKKTAARPKPAAKAPAKKPASKAPAKKPAQTLTVKVGGPATATVKVNLAKKSGPTQTFKQWAASVDALLVRSEFKSIDDLIANTDEAQKAHAAGTKPLAFLEQLLKASPAEAPKPEPGLNVNDDDLLAALHWLGRRTIAESKREDVQRELGNTIILQLLKRKFIEHYVDKDYYALTPLGATWYTANKQTTAPALEPPAEDAPAEESQDEGDDEHGFDLSPENVDMTLSNIAARAGNRVRTELVKDELGSKMVEALIVRGLIEILPNDAVVLTDAGMDWQSAFNDDPESTLVPPPVLPVAAISKPKRVRPSRAKAKAGVA